MSSFIIGIGLLIFLLMTGLIVINAIIREDKYIIIKLVIIVVYGIIISFIMYFVTLKVFIPIEKSYYSSIIYEYSNNQKYIELVVLSKKENLTLQDIWKYSSYLTIPDDLKTNEPIQIIIYDQNEIQNNIYGYVQNIAINY